jgi:ectoine hydroxylase-related dioxygenase (phytanoyl-CoA dioxygenase family)
MADTEAWERDGFFFVRGMIGPGEAHAIEAAVVERIRADPPENHPGVAAYLSGPDAFIFPEKAPSPTAVSAEERIAKVFNCHVEGAARAVAERAEILDALEDLLGRDIDCFQSQFIFKHPGVIGQPWHQDSYYFRFDRQPQVGVWVALSPATLDNGCLWVLPGSHRQGAIFNHVPDRRTEALRGYLEIVDRDVSGETPALMETGDVLFFHSYLMHRSTDNVAPCRRSAMVYHYGRAGTAPLTPDAAAALANVNRWLPVRRSR